MFASPQFFICISTHLSTMPIDTEDYNDMRKIILPFTINVEAKAYQYSAYALGAIKASLTDSHLWAAGKFLSIYFESNNQLHMYDADFWSINEGITTQSSITINLAAMCLSRSELLEVVKHKIIDGNYIVGMFDEFYIPRKISYGKRHYFHDYLLYGFDESQQILKAAGYLDNARYDVYDIPYDAYLDSITLCDTDEVTLYFRYVDNQYVPTLPIADIRCKLEDILLSKPNLPHYKGELEKTFGIAGMKLFQRYITDFNQDKLDLRNSRTYTEYFQYMYSRLQVLALTGYLDEDNWISNYYRDLVKPSLLIHNMCVKYNVYRNEEVLTHASDMIHTVNMREIDYIKRLLEKLDSTL